MLLSDPLSRSAQPTLMLARPRRPRSSLTHLVLPVALTHLPELVPGQLARLASLDLTHSIVEALPPSWCCHLQVGGGVPGDAMDVRGAVGG